MVCRPNRDFGMIFAGQPYSECLNGFSHPVAPDTADLEVCRTKNVLIIWGKIAWDITCVWSQGTDSSWQIKPTLSLLCRCTAQSW